MNDRIFEKFFLSGKTAASVIQTPRRRTARRVRKDGTPKENGNNPRKPAQAGKYRNKALFPGRTPAASSRQKLENPAAGRSPRRKTAPLLDLDLRSHFLELLLDVGRLLLGGPFLEGSGRAIDQVLGFLQPQGRHFPDDLDRLDLVSRGR